MTLQQKNSLKLHIRTIEELMGRLAVASIGYIQVIVLGLVAEEFSPFILFFY